MGQRFWHVCPNPYRPYAQTNVKLGLNKWTAITLHRFLWEHWGAAHSEQIDHVSRDGLDCRRANLRGATRSQNQANQGVQADSKSGMKGVAWWKGAWNARIGVNGKTVYLGRFKTIPEAARAYEQASYDFFGEFARAA